VSTPGVITIGDAAGDASLAEPYTMICKPEILNWGYHTLKPGDNWTHSLNK